MKLNKTILNQILDAYSVRPKEFESTEGEGFRYRSKVIKDYHLCIEFEKTQMLNAEGTEVVSERETGRIIVHHSDSRGKRIFNDIWAPDGNGGFYWFCRNPQKEPFTDYRIIQDLEDELNKVKAASKELQKEHSETVSLLEEQLAVNRSLRNTHRIIETNQKKAGRPKETERQQAIANEIEKLLLSGKSNAQIMQLLDLSRATFFRLKKLI